MLKTLESSAEQMKKENSQSVASNEAVQKHIEAQDKRISEMEAEIKRVEAEKITLLENNKVGKNFLLLFHFILPRSCTMNWNRFKHHSGLTALLVNVLTKPLLL